MDDQKLNSIFTKVALEELFPSSRTEEFFEALFGDNEEGAYDIVLGFVGYISGTSSLTFVLELHERPGKCLACNLTQGVPDVFSRHPIINVKGLVTDIMARLGDDSKYEWQLGRTIQQARNLHVVPLTITLG